MTKLVATLGMYDRPQTRAAMDRFWLAASNFLNEHDIPAPKALAWGQELVQLWNDDNLIMGQTCGWPYANHLTEKVRPLARFGHRLPECKDGFYYSVYIGQEPSSVSLPLHQNSLRDVERIAINSLDSQSGFHVFSQISKKNAPDTIPAEQRILSGAHLNSIRLVAEKKAELAAIDAVTFALAQSYEPELLRKVTILGNSLSTPGLPIVTSRKFQNKISILRSALRYALQTIDQADRDTLMIHDVLDANAEDYMPFKLSE